MEGDQVWATLHIVNREICIKIHYNPLCGLLLELKYSNHVSPPLATLLVYVPVIHMKVTGSMTIKLVPTNLIASEIDPLHLVSIVSITENANENLQ